MSDLHRLSLSDLSALIEGRQLGALELTDALIARCEAVAGATRAFVRPTFDLARDMARAADAEMAAGRRRGPLHGIPVALKDAYDTAGIPTEVSSRLHAGRVPAQDAEAWRRLQAAGAVLLGKLECTELCLGGPAVGGYVPYARNPWDAACTAGGSSSGAGVALATGMVPAALGTDTGGSIRIPAAICGVAGLKPTYGLISLCGVFPLSGSLDHAGPMARSSRDCAMLLDAIAGHDAGSASSLAAAPPGAAGGLTGRLDGLRVGYVRGFSEAEGVSAEQRAATEAALSILADLGAEVREAVLPDLWDFTVCNTTIMSSEAFAIHGNDFRRRAGLVSEMTRARISLGAFVRAEDYIRAQKARRRLARTTAEVMEHHDVLVYPCQPGDPPLVSEVRPFYYLRTPLLTTPANVAGVPAASVRCGLSGAGLPMAFQVTGRLFGDATVLRVADAFETATPELSRIADPV